MTHKPIIIAEQDAIDSFPNGVARILDVLGHPEALVTDLSQVFDFLSHFGDEADNQRENAEMLAKLSELAGREVRKNSYLWEIARDIEQQARAPSIH